MQRSSLAPLALFFVLSALLFNLNTTAQKLTEAKLLYKSEAKKNGPGINVLAVDDKGVTFSEPSNDGTWIRRVDLEGNLLRETPLAVANPDKISLVKTHVIDDDLYVFYCQSIGATELKAFQMNTKTLERTIDDKVLRRFKEKNPTPTNGIGTIVISSQDNKSIMIAMHNFAKRVGEMELEFHTVVVDRDLKEIWQQDLELPKHKDKMSCSDILLTNSNEILIVSREGRTFDDEGYKINRFNGKSAEPDEIMKLNPSGKFLIDLDIFQQDNGRLLLLGRSCEERKDYSTHGIMTAEISSDFNGVEVLDEILFTDSRLSLLYPEKNHQKLQYVHGIEFRHLADAEGGESAFIGELGSGDLNGDPIAKQAGMASFITFRKSFVVFNVDEKGQILATKCLPKLQEESGWPRRVAAGVNPLLGGAATVHNGVESHVSMDLVDKMKAYEGAGKGIVVWSFLNEDGSIKKGESKLPDLEDGLLYSPEFNTFSAKSGIVASIISDKERGVVYFKFE